MDVPELRWGVVGCGIISNEMAGALAAQDRHIDAVANRTHAKALDYAARHGVPKVYETADELFADADIDAVYITTPHNTHIRYLRAALAAGKHVVCEKSITLNTAELDEAIALARENDVILMDACTILHMPLYKELRRRMLAGDFGPVNLVQNNFGSYKELDANNRFFNPNLAGGAMLDIGIYALTAARLFLASAPDQMHSLMTPAFTGTDDLSGMVMRNAEGQIATITLSMHSKQPKRALVSCDKCYIEIDEYPRADSARIVWTDDGRVEEVRAGQRDKALAYVLADMEAAVAGDKSLAEFQLAVSRDVMALMTDARYSWDFYYPEER